MKFADGDKVRLNNGMVDTICIVRGIATVPMPVIGASYILKCITSLLPNKEYPYEYLTGFECHLEKIE